MRHLLLLAVIAVSHPAHAKCSRQDIMQPNLLTRRDTRVPADGGIVVGYAYNRGDNEVEKTRTDDPSDVLWTARDVKRKPVALARTSLAPGLSVFRPAATTDFVVVDAAGTQVGSFTRGGKPIVIDAPLLKTVRYKTEGATEMRWSPSTRTILELAKAPPAEAIAVIVYIGDKPVTFTTLADTHDKQLSLDIYDAGGHCPSAKPTGTGAVGANSTVTFAYVDTFGRLSPQSKPVTVSRELTR